jgi:hypothetical protein
MGTVLFRLQRRIFRADPALSEPVKILPKKKRTVSSNE